MREGRCVKTLRIARRKRQQQVLALLLRAHLLVRFGGIARPVVEVEAGDCEADAERLYPRHGVAEPDDGEDDDEDALDQACYAVCDW